MPAPSPKKKNALEEPKLFSGPFSLGADAVEASAVIHIDSSGELVFEFSPIPCTAQSDFISAAWHRESSDGGKGRTPRASEAQFDLATSDVTIGGKERADSGKGVKAILHAAVNVALLLYCGERNLPHPGLIVLDTPLLTYREPLGSKYGELSADEVELQRTGLATRFYDHLASLKDIGQFIVIENEDPPSDVAKPMPIETFTANPDSGRYGLFPLKRTG